MTETKQVLVNKTVERPIIFSGEMVRAILDGRKTQTRRVMKPQPTDYPEMEWYHLPQGFVPSRRTEQMSDKFWHMGIPCPYGKPGDRLWVRETTQKWRDHNGQYRATMTPVIGDKAHRCLGRAMWWYNKPVCPSIHMPRWASRITLEIVGVRPERLRLITVADATAEGLDPRGAIDKIQYRKQFIELWDHLNAKRGYGWAVNPWVWVIEFKRIE